ncbi:hypothetical protein OPKNFCMD_1419 [Methylobacterium crusticola]|uniref:Heme-binding protein n=1 Tax=Methylobacterium crusticola TaxID=1697972 RepID=A0ABQ4QVL6_9HYPH|nr:heme-binding protein [Methylobacterium crusticola]GJD48696.1 hypothetical protein OPKNFCMD_1419 [Methylobacterium crusticola]
MEKALYYLVTLAEAGLSLLGIRATYEQPAYAVREIREGVEIRAYAPRTAVETATEGPGDSAAFRRLFAYITGANRDARLIAMTVPVSQGAGQRVAGAGPVEEAGEALRMRFFLPRKVVAAGAPVPTDPRVRLVDLPAETVAALRFSGVPTPEARRAHEARLLAALARSGRRPAGAPALLGYDPPSTPGFLRRNEVVVVLADPP